MVASCSSAHALETHWRQDTANLCKKRRWLARCGWGTREGRSVMVLGHRVADRHSPRQRRRRGQEGRPSPDPVVNRGSFRAGRDRAGRARERLPPSGWQQQQRRARGPRVDREAGRTYLRLPAIARLHPSPSDGVPRQGDEQPSMLAAAQPSRARQSLVIEQISENC